MSNISLPKDYLTTLSEEQISALTTSPISSISISSSGTGYCYTSPITYTSATSTCYTISNSLNIGHINVWGATEWVDSFPSWSRIEKMCEEYPGLKIAFEKFKNTYKLVQDDFDTPENKRAKP